MSLSSPNKRKIYNDPVYGFITIPAGHVFRIVEHPFFQRLRRIKQLGLTHLVYPGALHTRFHHSIGAMYLMQQTISVLRMKGQTISHDEEIATLVAILLHDIGHGPYSHTLEHSIVKNIHHEEISILFMEALNEEFNQELSLAIEIFKGNYEKKYLNKLIASQLDMDRLDYLKRDSFFTGVSEGVVSAERIIKMLDIVDNDIAVEAKGIYSIEKFIIARRIMYWQVYLHKTVLGAENMLMMILKRAKYLSEQGTELFATPVLKLFLETEYKLDDFKENPELLKAFAKLDDFDILTSIKVWTDHSDKVLSILCQKIVNRRLFRIEIQNEPFEDNYLNRVKERTKDQYKLSDEELEYMVISDITSNFAYDPSAGKINILYKNGEVTDVSQASDQLNISVLENPVTKHFIAYPKDVIPG